MLPKLATSAILAERMISRAAIARRHGAAATRAGPASGWCGTLVMNLSKADWVRI
ncbi:hypothetical protein GCM10011504_01520 [Siccirubricoccus deserti]|nr:hypothetical protein GCM10011504_01520 [Siccirubricoccus deserti]